MSNLRAPCNSATRARARRRREVALLKLPSTRSLRSTTPSAKDAEAELATAPALQLTIQKIKKGIRKTIQPREVNRPAHLMADLVDLVHQVISWNMAV